MHRIADETHREKTGRDLESGSQPRPELPALTTSGHEAVHRHNLSLFSSCLLKGNKMKSENVMEEKEV